MHGVKHAGVQLTMAQAWALRAAIKEHKDKGLSQAMRKMFERYCREVGVIWPSGAPKLRGRPAATFWSDLAERVAAKGSGEQGGA